MNKPLQLLLVFLAVSLFNVAEALAATDVYVNPALTNVDLGDSFSIDVDIDTDDDVYAVQFDLLFDNSRLNATGAAEGAFLKQGGTSTFCASSLDNSAGKYTYACTRFGVQTGATGTGTLLTMSFDTLSFGTSSLNLDFVVISDSSLQPVTATVTDGSVKVNRASSASNLQISPSSPYTADDLTGSYSYSDPDGDPESGSEIRWYRDAAHQPSYDDVLTVPSGATARGQYWHFTVRPSDGTSFGTLQTSPTVTIQNSQPTAPVVDITPGSPVTGDNLVCGITTPSTDPDGDTVTYSYAWYKDSVLQPGQTASTVSSSLTGRGETWKCVVTPNDGTDDGPAGEDEVTVQNSAPTSPVVDVTPDSPVTDDDLTCGITTPSTDPDGDTVTYSYAWFKNGALQGALTTGTVDSSYTSKGQVWRCEVTASDGTATSPAASDQVTVGNSPPTAPVVDVTPDAPVRTDHLTCGITTPSTDADGDTVTYSYAWYKDGALQPGQTTSTVSSGLTGRGETWKCVVTPYDGTDNGPPGEDEVTIQNLGPNIFWYIPASLSLETREGYSLQFDHNSTDPDGDSLTYSWTFNGTEKATTQSWLFYPTTAECGSGAVDLTVSDGQLTDSQSWNVDVGLRGDVVVNYDVDIFDLAAVGRCYGCSPGESCWTSYNCEDADISPGPGPDGTPEGDGAINIFDLATVGLNYGRSC